MKKNFIFALFKTLPFIFLLCSCNDNGGQSQSYDGRTYDISKNQDGSVVAISSLNNNYYNSFSDADKEKIVKGKWFVGAFTSDDGYDYESVYTNSIEAYVGLLSINDLGLLEYNNVWTLTPSTSKNDVIYTVGSDGTVYSDSIGKTKYVRPVLYLDSNIKITDGKGSKEEPYVVE